MALVEAKGVSKRFGSVRALERVSLTAAPSRVVCLVGPNGAGKTTLLRIIMGLLEPDEGEVRVFGRESWDESLRSRAYYLPQEAGLPKGLTGREFLSFIASVYGRGSADRGAELSGLGKELDRRVETYSVGMKRRLLVAAGLMVEPELLVLDEPTAGLDVSHSLFLRDAIASYAKEKSAAVIYASHNMLEVQYVCDEVLFLHKGLLVEAGAPQEIMEKHRAKNLEEVFVRVAK
ncbi:MAG: ABC transporter ATP-binding protein [Acidilobaceae archaeon]|nr:ABC transporter ATP-binding protein [Acidilobaceae archaeon]